MKRSRTHIKPDDEEFRQLVVDTFLPHLIEELQCTGMMNCPRRCFEKRKDAL